jgi:hypothetical protein
MSDDSPTPPSKRGTNPRSLGNLRPAVKGEPGRNQTGNNGRTRGERVAKILDAPAITTIELAMVRKLGLPDNTPMIDALVHREIVAGLGKSDLARKGLREQYAGKPRQQMDLSSGAGSMSPGRKATTAETRQELDRVLEALGSAPPAGEVSQDSSAPEAEGGPVSEGEAAKAAP